MLTMETLTTKEFEKALSKKGEKPETGLTVDEAAAKAMIRMLSAELDLKTQVQFSSRLRNTQIPCFYRPAVLLLPDGQSGLLTESRIIHELAHLLTFEQSKPKPHGPEFKESLARLQAAWFGKL